jgi:protein transport protein SEC13
MASRAAQFETGHEEMIHDAQMDYYGKRLATASSDRTIKIFEVAGEKQTLLATLSGHDSPVWQVSWAHPKFGGLLASCSYEGKVVVWKEMQPNKWEKIYENNEAGASVNAVAWAPLTFGLKLAAASANGTVTVFSHRDDNQWAKNTFLAHHGGVNAVSWGPDLTSGALLGKADAGTAPWRFVTGGCDKTIKIWGWDDQRGWINVGQFENDDNKHGDWVRDVAWAPSVGLLTNTIASCSEDKSVIIWSEHQGRWRKKKQLPFDTKVWKASWSVMGNILAVSQGDNKVSLWKESVDGEWVNLSTVTEEGTGPPSAQPERKDPQPEALAM